MQSVFRKNSATQDHAFTIRQICEKTIKMCRYLCVCVLWTWIKFFDRIRRCLGDFDTRGAWRMMKVGDDVDLCYADDMLRT